MVLFFVNVSFLKRLICLLVYVLFVLLCGQCVGHVLKPLMQHFLFFEIPYKYINTCKIKPDTMRSLFLDVSHVSCQTCYFIRLLCVFSVCTAPLTDKKLVTQAAECSTQWWGHVLLTDSRGKTRHCSVSPHECSIYPSPGPPPPLLLCIDARQPDIFHSAFERWPETRTSCFESSV